MDTKETTQNVTDRSPYDYFKCQMCGIQLADYVKINYKDGVQQIWAYKMKYCPECGRKVADNNEG